MANEIKKVGLTPPKGQRPKNDHLFLTPNDKRAFLSLVEPQYPSIQEDLFVSQWLPLFLSEDPDKPIMDWLDVSGHALNPVNVFQGEEYQFTVPALFRDTPIAPNQKSRISYYDIVTGMNDHYALSQQHGDMFMENALKDRVLHTPVEIRNLRQWNFIFERYGYKPRYDLSKLDKVEEKKEAPVKKGVLGEPDGFDGV